MKKLYYSLGLLASISLFYFWRGELKSIQGSSAQSGYDLMQSNTGYDLIHSSTGYDLKHSGTEYGWLEDIDRESASSDSEYEPTPQESLLIEAAKNGNLKKVKELISQGVNPKARNRMGHTAWYYARERGHHAITRFGQELAASEVEQTCCVCLEKVGRSQFELGSPTHDCLHFICRDCKGHWRSTGRSQTNCPICRH